MREITTIAKRQVAEEIIRNSEPYSVVDAVKLLMIEEVTARMVLSELRDLMATNGVHIFHYEGYIAVFRYPKGHEKHNQMPIRHNFATEVSAYHFALKAFVTLIRTGEFPSEIEDSE